MNEIKIFFIGFKHGFQEFGHIITNIVNFILLFIVYFIGVGLTSMIAKISGKHFLKLKKENRKSNWRIKKIGKQPIEEYYRQF